MQEKGLTSKGESMERLSKDFSERATESTQKSVRIMQLESEVDVLKAQVSTSKKSFETLELDLKEQMDARAQLEKQLNQFKAEEKESKAQAESTAEDKGGYS